jgi:hypothetical protein
VIIALLAAALLAYLFYLGSTDDDQNPDGHA